MRPAACAVITRTQSIWHQGPSSACKRPPAVPSLPPRLTLDLSGTSSRLICGLLLESLGPSELLPCEPGALGPSRLLLLVRLLDSEEESRPAARTTRRAAGPAAVVLAVPRRACAARTGPAASVQAAWDMAPGREGCRAPGGTRCAVLWCVARLLARADNPVGHTEQQED